MTVDLVSGREGPHIAAQSHTKELKMHYSASTSVEAAADIESALSLPLGPRPATSAIVKAAKLLASTLAGSPIGISVVGQDDSQVEVRVWVTAHPEVEV